MLIKYKEKLTILNFICIDYSFLKSKLLKQHYFNFTFRELVTLLTNYLFQYFTISY